MGDDHHGDPCPVDFLKDIHHFEGGDRIQSTGRLIGQYDLRFVISARAIAIRCFCPL